MRRMDDIATAFGFHPNEAVKYLNRLLEQGAVRTENISDKILHIRV